MSRENELLERYDAMISETEQVLLYPFVMESQDGVVMQSPSGEDLRD